MDHEIVRQEPTIDSLTTPRDFTRDAVLVRISAHLPSAFVRAPAIRDTIAAAHQADPKSMAIAVRLLPESALRPLRREVKRAHAALKRRSVKWDDAGYRLVPFELYPYLRGDLDDAVASFRQIVRDLVDRRDEWAATFDQRGHHGLGEARGFPSRDDLLARCQLIVSEMPVTWNAHDPRLRHVNAEVVTDIKDEVAAAARTKLRPGLLRLIQALKGMVESVQATGQLRDLGAAIEGIIDAVEKANLGDRRVTAEIARVRNALPPAGGVGVPNGSSKSGPSEEFPSRQSSRSPTET